VELHLPKHQLTLGSLPQPRWWTLSEAVFQFGIAQDDGSTDLPERKVDDVVKSATSHWLDHLTRSFEERQSPLSLNELTKILTEITRADQANIDPMTNEASFSFTTPMGGSHSVIGTFWAFLKEPIAPPLPMQPKVEITLQGEDGPLWFESTDRSLPGEKVENVRKAINLVWRQWILPAFNRAVSTGTIVLYARTPTLEADYTHLPADVWTDLRIADWTTGVATTPDGKTYWSIYVGLPPVAGRIMPQFRGKRSRGRRPLKREAIVQAMLSDIREGRTTPTCLESMLEKELAEKYGASRYTVRKARNVVMRFPKT
jgi:Bacterial regulatory proteins, gntR family